MDSVQYPPSGLDSCFLQALQKCSIIQWIPTKEIDVMKSSIDASSTEKTEKISPLAYVLSVALIAMAVVAVASIMACSLPY